MIDVQKTVISQYAHSPVILELINRLNQCLCPADKIAEFYDLVWNIETAQGYGLDVWGQIVGMERNFKMVSEGEYLGFADGFLAFDDGVWSRGAGNTGVYTMSDNAYRQMILIKAMKNIMYATAYNINRLLMAMFEKRGRAYFYKTGTMTARYIFEFDLTNEERAILLQSDILPRPSGVLIDFLEPSRSKYFGFDEAGYSPFNNGVFYLEI